MATPDITVLVVDDQAPFRAAARAVVGRTEGFRWVGDAGSADEAVAAVTRLRPDLVVMDVHLGAVDGIEATRRVRAAVPGTLVVLCSGHDRSDLPDGAPGCGALTYVDKADLSSEVLRRVWARRAEGWIDSVGP